MLTEERRSGSQSGRSAAQPTTRVITDLTSTEAIATQWNRLGQRSGNPVGLHSWAVASAAAHGATRPLSVVVVEEGSEIVALAPLARRGGARARLELLGLHQIYEPTDFSTATLPPSSSLPGRCASSGIRCSSGASPPSRRWSGLWAELSAVAR